MMTSQQWTHIVLNYIGSDNGQGTVVYFNAVQMRRDVSKVSKRFSTGDGRFVVGRQRTDGDGSYASVDMDELLFFNYKLSNTQIIQIKNMT